ncbi:MAG: DNA primase [Candidatus Omnitrophota bacterium]
MGLISEEIIAQVLDRSDIAETVGSYIPLKRAGRNFKACCPFHNEKTPSFVVNVQKQIFHCFGCGVGGNVVTFVMKQERIEFPEALRLLARKVNIEIPDASPADRQTLSLKEVLYSTNDCAVRFFHENLISSKEPSAVLAREYLKNRGLSLETVKKCKIGFALDQWDRLLNHLQAQKISLSFIEKAGLIVPQERGNGFYDRFRHRIIFPIFDVRLRCVAFGARAMKEGIAKYINSPETILYTKGQHLYGLHLAKNAIQEKDSVIVVEGYMDFLIPCQAGVENIVASQGTALTVEQIRLLRRYTKNIIMLFDTDKAGESAMVRSLDLLIDEGMNVKVTLLKAGEDPDSFVRKFGVKEFCDRLNQAKSLFDYKLNVLMGHYSHKTIEGKERIAAGLLPTIAKFKNAVVKFSYIKQLAEVLSVPEEALFLEMNKTLKGAQTTDQPALTQSILLKHTQAVERDLLRLILHDESCMATVRECLSLSDFQDEEIRCVMATMFELAEKGKDITVNNLMSCIQDEHLAQMIAQLVALEHPLTDNKERMLQDYISVIKKNCLKRELKSLSLHIKQAEETGDAHRLDDFRRQYNQLIKSR